MESKKGNMGLVIFVIVLIMLALGVIAYFVLNDQKNKEIEKAMKEPVLDYFDKYVSATSSASAYKITLGMLKEANENGENYNLKALDSCDDKKTYANVSIDYATGDVSGIEYKLNCKIW